MSTLRAAGAGVAAVGLVALLATSRSWWLSERIGTSMTVDVILAIDADCLPLADTVRPLGDASYLDRVGVAIGDIEPADAQLAWCRSVRDLQGEALRTRIGETLGVWP